MKRLAIALSVVALVVAGCGSTGSNPKPGNTTQPSETGTQGAAPGQAPQGQAPQGTAPEQAPTVAAQPFGTPVTVSDGVNTATVAFTVPKVKTFHEADYDPSCSVDPTGCSKPGAPFEPVVVTKVSWTGVSGSIDVYTAFTIQYEEPGGTLADQTLPLMTFEKFDPLSDHTTTLTPGQKTSGELAFDSSKSGGKVQVIDVMSGVPVAIFEG